MDYRGDYFSDDENEGLSEKAIKRKRIRRIIFYGFVFILYLIVFIRFARSCDADLIKELHFSDEARQLYESDKQNFVVYKINTQEFMNYDGTLQLKNIVCAETAGEFEIGVKYREPNEKKDSEEFSLVYELTDNLGTKYEICNRVSEKKNGYVYERISFKRVKLDFQYNLLNRSDKDKIYDDYVDEDSERNRKLILNVSDPSIGYEEEPMIIYDNSTTYQKIKKVELAA
jgi:hypothetical protein